jgi:hypothetical protein
MRDIVILFFAGSSLVYAGVSVTTQQAEILPATRSLGTSTALLFPFVTDDAGFDTEITISNTSADTEGSSPQAGSCSLNFYGFNPPASVLTSTSIAAGQQLVFDLSQGGGGIAAAPGFQGYIIANCSFPGARGAAKILGGTHFAFSQDAQVLTLPRSTAQRQLLLFPFVTNENGFDTGIAIANTSSDPFGTSPTSGTCSLNFYGAAAPARPIVTPTIASGTVYATLASVITPGFQGYVIAVCNFSEAATIAFVSDVGAERLAYTETAVPITTPRSALNSSLLFSQVTNQNGQDTAITIANTTTDPFGTPPVSGSCTLSFYGANAPSPITTPAIASGTVYTALASLIAPDFQGYMVASCQFPLANGWAFLGPFGATADGDSEAAELVTTPRSVTPAALLFTAAGNWGGNDTSIVISNTSEDPFGTQAMAGTCAINYFGSTLGASIPPPQTSTSIQPGSQLSFTISKGNPAQGISPAPGFRGYVIANCGFPLARGLATTSGSPASKPGIFRDGFLWLLDVNGNHQFDSPPDDVFAFGGVPGDIPITGDWSGSGTTKIGIYRPSNGLFILDYNGNGQFDSSDKVYNLGVGIQPGDIPVVGDWNGTGISKIGIFRQGFFWILDTNGDGMFDSSDQSFAFGGVAGDVPVVGDWNASGTSKVGVFRSGFLWILDTNGDHMVDAGDQVFAFGGIPGDVPVVGDWNGDGRTKVGVFRDGFFWVLDTNGDQMFDLGDEAFAFGGIAGDIPVTGKW